MANCAFIFELGVVTNSAHAHAHDDNKVRDRVHDRVNNRAYVYMFPAATNYFSFNGFVSGAFLIFSNVTKSLLVTVPIPKKSRKSRAEYLAK